MKQDQEQAVKKLATPQRRLWFSQRGLWRSPDDGGGAPAQTTPTPAAPNPAGNQGSSTAGGFTQEHIDRAAGRARQEGREQGVKGFLEELGITDPEALKNLVATNRQREEADKSELQKTADKLARLEQKTAEQLVKVSAHLVKAKAEALAAKLGLDPAKATAFLGTFSGGFANFKVDLETGEVEGLEDAFKSLQALIGQPQEGEQINNTPPAPPAPRQFVRQNSGGQPPKTNAARSYVGQTYGNKPKQ